MAVKIGHASIDENNAAKGGKAGDQTGKELCTRDWYTKGWNVLLRPLRSDLAEKSAAAIWPCWWENSYLQTFIAEETVFVTISPTKKQGI